MEEQKSEPRKLPDSFLIAAIAPIAYLYSFIFEAGSITVYKIPIEFISITLMNIFIAGLSFIIIGIILIVIIDMITAIFQNNENPIVIRLSQIFPIFIGTLAYIFFVLGTPLARSLIGIVVGWIYILYMQLVHPLITQRHIHGYRNKLLAESKIKGKGILTDLAKKFRSYYMLTFYLMISLFITYYAGMSSSYQKTTYLVTNTSPEMIVLKVYSNRLIVAPLNIKDRTISSEFVIINLDNENVPILTLENIGQISNP
jgi:hypothetical protein